jgi:hypothetical protein
MAQNRFRRVFYEPDTRIPQYARQEFYPDMSGVEQVMSGYQAAADKMYDIPIPKHTDYDRQFIDKEYLGPIREMREKAIDAWTTGSAVDGLRAARELDRFVVQSKQPGGVFENFESRYAQQQKDFEAIQKVTEKKDRQDLAPFLRTRIGYRGFRGENNQLQGYGALSHSSVLAPDEMDKWANDQLPWVKETLKKDFGYGAKYDLDRFTSVHEMYKTMGVDFNKVLYALAQRMPDEFKGAARQDYMSKIMSNPDLFKEDYDPSQIFEFDDKGNVKYDKNGNLVTANTEMGRWLGGIAYGAQYIKRDNEWIKVTDDVGQHKAKKDIDDNAKFTMQTATYSTGIELPGVNFDKEGNVVSGGASTTDLMGAISAEGRVIAFGMHASLASPMDPSKIDMSGVSKLPPKVAFNSDEFKASNPVGYQVWSRLREKAEAENWDDKTIMKKFNEVYEGAKDQYKTQDFTFSAYADSKTQKEETETIIGSRTSSAPGLIAHSTLFVMEPGKAPRLMDYAEMMKTYGINQTYFNQAATVVGELKGGENTIPEGKVATFTTTKSNDPKQKGDYKANVTMIITDVPIEEVQRKMPQYELSSVAFDPAKEISQIQNINITLGANASPSTQAIAQQLSQGVFSKKEAVFQSDILMEQKRYWTSLKSQREKAGLPFGKYEEDTLESISNQIKELKELPEKDRYVETRASLYSPQANNMETPIMINDGIGIRVMTTKDLNSFLNNIRQ